MQKENIAFRKGTKNNLPKLKTLEKEDEGTGESFGDRLLEDSASCSTRDSLAFEETYDCNELQKEGVEISERERKIIEYLDRMNVTLTVPRDKKDSFFDENRRRLWQTALGNGGEKRGISFLTPQSTEKRENCKEEIQRSSSLWLNVSESKFMQRRKKSSVSSTASALLNYSDEGGKEADFKTSNFSLKKWWNEESKSEAGSLGAQAKGE